MYVLDLHGNISVVLTVTGIILLTTYSCPCYCRNVFCRTFKKVTTVCLFVRAVQQKKIHENKIMIMKKNTERSIQTWSLQ